MSQCCALAGLWSTILKSSMLFNLPFGPWGGAKWFRKMCEAGEEYFQVSNAEDPILQVIWQRHCRDAAQDPGDSEAFMAWLVGLPWSKTFTAKGTRVVLSRWFSWMHAARDVYPRRHALLAVLLFLGVTSGYVKSSGQVFRKDPWELPGAAKGCQLGSEAACAQPDAGRSAAAAASAQPATDEAACPQPGTGGGAIEAACPQPAARDAAACPQTQGSGIAAAEEKETVAHGQSDEQVANLRHRCKNTLHASLVVAADDDLWTSVGMILVATRAVTQAHGRHASFCRAPTNVMRWYAGQAVGAPPKSFEI